MESVPFHATTCQICSLAFGSVVQHLLEVLDTSKTLAGYYANNANSISDAELSRFHIYYELLRGFLGHFADRMNARRFRTPCSLGAAKRGGRFHRCALPFTETRVVQLQR